MADGKSILEAAAQLMQGGSDTPSACPTCGRPHDDIPEPNAKNAAAMQKGATESGDPLVNFVKSKLGS